MDVDLTAFSDEPQERPPPSQAGARVVAFGGGKGGVGRTMLAANIGAYLAQVGKRVVLVDADFGGANLHTVLGINVPGKTLSDVLLRKRESLAEIILETPIPGLGLISGAGDLTGVDGNRAPERSRFLQMLAQLDVDYVLMDLRSGTEAADTLDLFLLADTGIIVMSPEPTSVENSYRFLKSAFFRRIWNLENYKSMRGLLAEAHVSVQEFGFMSPPALLNEVRRRFPDLAAPLLNELDGFRPYVVVNMCRTRRDREMGDEVVSACRRKLHISLRCLGSVEHDDSVWLSVCHRRPAILEYPEARPAQDIESIARGLLSLDTERRGRRTAPEGA